MTETRTIEITVYRDTEGRPACKTCDSMCELLYYDNWDHMPDYLYNIYCWLTEDDLVKDGDFVRPSANCPLWRDSLPEPTRQKSGRDSNDSATT